jgi:hypothetical protein
VRWAAAGVALTLAVWGPAATAAEAEAVDAERFTELVERAAAGDGEALADLRRVERVDGRPVDMAAALAERPRERLDALRAPASDGAPDADADAARRSAQEVLDGRAFHPPSVPRPLEGVLRRLGSWLEPLGRPLGAAYRWITEEPARFLPLAAAVVLEAGWVAVLLGRRRAPLGHEPAGRRLRRPDDDPALLERQAEEAEAAGDLDLAVRLRFRAGLVRLDRAGVLRFHPSLTTGAVTRAVPSQTLSRLAADFDEIAYGGRRAEPDDLASSRAGWPRVLTEVRR